MNRNIPELGFLKLTAKFRFVDVVDVMICWEQFKLGNKTIDKIDSVQGS